MSETVVSETVSQRELMKSTDGFADEVPTVYSKHVELENHQKGFPYHAEGTA